MDRVTLRPVSIDRRGGVMRGTFYESGDTDRRRPAVVMLHGFTGHRMESDFMFVRLARSLAAAGLHAVAFDFLGSGESDGEFSDMRVSGELDDALAVLQWVGARRGVDRSRIGLLGFSLGGLLAACASALSPVKALALLAPTTAQNVRRYAQPNGHAATVIASHKLHGGFFEDLDRHDPLGDVTKHPRPTLLIHGAADKAVPPRVGRQYENALSDAGIDLTTLWIDGANHTFTGPETRRTLNQAVTDFFRERL